MAGLPGKTYPTPKSIRLAMARIVEDYRLGSSHYDQSEYRAIMWGFTQILSALKLEKELDIEKRLEELEARIDGRTR